MSKTIFCDLDGTLFVHHGSFDKQLSNDPSLIPGAREKLTEWNRLGYRLIITTGRPETYRMQTEEQLESLFIPFDQLVMDCCNGPRVLINDMKPDGTLTAEAINVERNKPWTE